MTAGLSPPCGNGSKNTRLRPEWGFSWSQYKYENKVCLYLNSAQQIMSLASVHNWVLNSRGNTKVKNHRSRCPEDHHSFYFLLNSIFFSLISCKYTFILGLWILFYEIMCDFQCMDPPPPPSFTDISITTFIPAIKYAPTTLDQADPSRRNFWLACELGWASTSK